MYKIITKSAFIFFLFSLQSCSIHCMLRPENKFEEILEQFVEEELNALSEKSVDSIKKTQSQNFER